MDKIRIFICLVLFSMSSSLIGQDSIYVENFDADSANLPQGWWADSSGFYIMNNNPSFGYNEASGNNNLGISNTISPSGKYVVYSKWINVRNYANLKLMFASRVTTKFYDSGSVVEGVFYRDNLKAQWINASYKENSNNSLWGWVNFSTPIKLDSIEYLTDSVQLKWVVQIKNQPSGTYRIDDVILMGEKVNGISIAPPPSSVCFYYDRMNRQIYLNESMALHIRVYDLSGKLVHQGDGNLANAGMIVGLYIIEFYDPKKEEARTCKMFIY